MYAIYATAGPNSHQNYCCCFTVDYGYKQIMNKLQTHHGMKIIGITLTVQDTAKRIGTLSFLRTIVFASSRI